MSQAAKTSSSTNPPAGAAQPEANNRILIVDDEPGLLEEYKAILNPPKTAAARSSRQAVVVDFKTANNFSFEVVTAQNTKDAIAAVQKSVQTGKPFAMGFFDVKLGESIDGFELFKHINEIDPDLMGVFVTAHHDRTIDSINQALGDSLTGHWDYLAKPFQPTEIIQKARNYVALWNLKQFKRAKDEERASLNQRVLESDRLNTAMTLTRGIGHEFGNILMQIMGKAEISLAKDPKGMKDGLEVILDACQKASDILDRFEDLSSQEKMKAPLALRSLNEVVDKGIELMEFMLRKNRIQICKPKWDQVKVHLDVTSMIQLIVNLTINSVHAMGENGTVDISIEDSKDEVLLSIRDHGPGVSQENIDKILQPFFTTKGDKGTGLGLSICKEIVEERHGGELEIQNHPSGGFLVKMKIPKRSESNSKTNTRRS